jgi:hypothetical protein
VLGQPDLARRRQVEAADETPLVAPWNRAPRLQVQLGPYRWRDNRTLHRYSQPIAHARHGDDDGVVAQGLAQFGDGGGERGVDNREPGPHRVEQLLLRQHLAGMHQQLAQDVERLHLDVHGKAMDAKLATRLVELAISKPPDLSGSTHSSGFLSVPLGQDEST